jgi:hypothetical protein
MRYIVEFEMHTDSGDAAYEAVQKALVSAVGGVLNLRIAPMRTYNWNIQSNESTTRSVVRPL